MKKKRKKEKKGTSVLVPKSENQFNLVELRKKYDTIRGIDGTSITHYYNPNPYTKTQKILGKINPLFPIVWFMEKYVVRKIIMTNDSYVYFFNIGELSRLEQTTKRGKFDWFSFGDRFIINLTGFQWNYRNVGSSLQFILTNFLLLWGLIIWQFSNPDNCKTSIIFVILVGFMVFTELNHSLHIYWRMNDEIEQKKLFERSDYLEERIMSTLISLIKFNIFCSLFLKWFSDNGYVKFVGNNLEILSEWLKLALDNMILFFAFFDVVAPFGFKGFSSIQKTDTISLILLLSILIINHFIGFKTVKLVLLHLENQGLLPKWTLKIIELI
jgi:hypothetical protein